MKRTVIERLRHADQWLAAHGGLPWQWLRELVRDATQELESESGSLWMQWTTSPTGHVRIFVAGEMGPKELDSLLEVLKLSRSFMEKDEVAQVEADRLHALTEPPQDQL